MKTIHSIFLFFFFQTGFSQFANNDSLIRNPVDFNQYLLTIKEIDSAFIKNDSVTRMIDSAMKWNFICSYKKGWEEVIGFNSATSTVKALKKSFLSLTSGRIKGYVIYFSSAKQSQTRISRIENCRDKIMLGQGLNDDYKKNNKNQG
jgi:hypothetical protein